MGQFLHARQVVEAVRWTGDPWQKEQPDWMRHALQDGSARLEGEGRGPVPLRLYDGDTVRTARPGDWIVRNPDGTIYPVSAPQFRAFFRKADDAPAATDAITSPFARI
jgi:MoaA/NifB/PqqE/SkfB family radical SAM enzyme